MLQNHWTASTFNKNKKIIQNLLDHVNSKTYNLLADNNRFIDSHLKYLESLSLRTFSEIANP